MKKSKLQIKRKSAIARVLPVQASGNVNSHDANDMSQISLESYAHAFATSPIFIWNEDFSEVKRPSTQNILIPPK